MNQGVISVLSQINFATPNFLKDFIDKLSKALKILNIEEFKDIADGLRQYLGLIQDLDNDILVNKILAILTVIYFYNLKINKETLLFELNKLIIRNPENEEVNNFISIIEYFINNLSDIVSTADKESDIHKKKLILMEKVNKFIEDNEIRDKTVDLILLMNSN